MATTCNIPKTCSVLVGILSVHLCYFNSLVVDDFLSGCFLISSGFFMVVHTLFWGYSLVILAVFLLCFMEDLPLVHVVVSLSVAFFLFLHLIAFVYFCWCTCSV